MLKHKAELLLLIILVPILVYVGWQAYKTYIKPPEMDIEELEKTIPSLPAVEEPKEIAEPAVPAQMPYEPTVLPAAQEQQKPIEPEKTLDYTGYTERDPLKPVLPVKEKIEKLPEPAPGPEPEITAETKPGEITQEPAKEIVLPAFSLTGFVWGAAPSAIIDDEIYKIGDIIKGAKIIAITEQGVHLEFSGKDFWLSL